MVKKVFLVLLIITLLICSTNIVQATTITNIIEGADNFINNGSSTSTISGDKLKELSDTIYNVLLIIGTVIAVIIGAILGIQFITGSVEQKAKVKELLSSEEYKTLMKKRSTECETVFGQTKGNLGFRRFHLRGKEKVGTEWGLLMLGYDFKQLIRLMNT